MLRFLNTSLGISSCALGLAALFFLALAATASAQTPQITSIIPSSGPVGTKVTLIGSGFSPEQIVLFGSGAAIPEAATSTTRLTFTVPIILIPKCTFENPPCSPQGSSLLPGVYPISVAADYSFATTSNNVFFTVTPKVGITSIIPSSGPIGTTVTINGRGFSTIGNAINFGSNGVILQIGNSTSVIRFAIPSKILPKCAVMLPPCSTLPFEPATGVYAMSVAPNLDFSQVSNSGSFTLTSGSITPSAPVITSISPTAGTIGTKVTIKGYNFSPNLNVIDFGSGVIIPQFSGNDLVFNVPSQLFPRCTIFGNPPCQVTSAPQLTPGTYSVDVALDATKISNRVQFTVNPVPTPTSTPALPPPPQNLGDQVKATENINVREAPSLSTAILGVEQAGSIGNIADGPVSADGYEWFQVGWEDGLLGWSVKNYLVASSQTICPIKIGDKITVIAGEQALSLYVRADPSVSAPIVGGELDGTSGTILSGPIFADGYSWWQLRFADGIVGWAIESSFIDISCLTFTITPTTPPPPPPSVSVSFVTPQAYATVSGLVPVTVSVSSTEPVAEVDFYVDGGLTTIVKTSPYTWSWDSTKAYNGSHSLRATARTASTSGSKSIIVNVTGGIPLPTPTPPPPPPPPAPVIKVLFITPQNGATVSGLIPVNVSVSSSVPITEVDFYADNLFLGVVSSTPYTVNWDATQVLNGLHSLTAVAIAAGASGRASITVTVTGGLTRPVVSFVTPQNGATVSGLTPVTVSVSADKPAVTKVDFYRDGLFLGSDSAAPYTVNWDATQVLNGSHSLTAIARTTNVSISGSNTITVNVTGGLSAPIVSFVKPLAGATVWGTVPIEVSVSANTPAVTGVDFYADNKVIVSGKTSPYVASWDSTDVVPGTHTLTATARTTNASISGSRSIQINVIPVPQFLAGDRVRVQTGSNEGLNVRSGPSTSNSIIATEPNGSLGTVVTSPPTFANTYYWYQIKWDNGGVTGWSVENYLVKQ
ncbi:MAG: Ig-like domain-containing protein [bacterium]|nr:Ig-like domain-containing protein [bacterium]